jgi:hypothetical protein
MSAPITKAAVARAVSGAIAGGLPPGSFRIRVDAERGVIDLLPINGNEAQPDEDGLDAEIRAFTNGQG